MTFMLSLFVWGTVVIVFAVAQASGFRVLEVLGFALEDRFETGLLAVGVSIPLIGFSVFGLSIPGWLDAFSAWGLIVILAIIAWRGGWRRSGEWFRLVLNRFHSYLKGAGIARWVTLSSLAFTVLLEALVSLAPLTGSDAMHYHFTTSLLEMGSALRPIFWLTHSFLTEQAHLLISLGMALGDARISLGLIFLGGLLSAAVLFTIARKLMSFDWALIAVVTFLISPMVFWQITTSGSPDIWMGFYTGLAIIAAIHGIQGSNLKFVLLAGFYAGTAAGVKYTGWAVPFGICAYLLVSRRSWKLVFPCVLISVVTGALIQVRNYIWTGDPFFPFLMPRLNPASMNSFALHSLVADTRSKGYSLHLAHILAFPITMALDGNRYGLGQYFGPLILAFGPLLLFARWKDPTAKLTAVIWALVLLSNALTSQMGRFLLPVYILALALVFSGLAGIFERGWKTAAYGCVATLVLFLGFAAFSDCLYARDFLPVVFGRENKEAFLRRMAPEYQFVAFINSTLAPKVRDGNGNTMVFLRHLYYLQVPYVSGDPASSWAVDPSKCTQTEGLVHTLKELNVRWIVKEPRYPAPLEDSFNRLETEKRLIPIASADLETLTGTSRIYGFRQAVRITILELAY
jgi:hypothetical protein